jgi:hypothetical protein
MAEITQEYLAKIEKMNIESLEKLGVKVRIAHFSGDSSFPTEYNLEFGDISAVGPRLDMAINEFIGKLLNLNKKLMEQLAHKC